MLELRNIRMSTLYLHMIWDWKPKPQYHLFFSLLVSLRSLVHQWILRLGRTTVTRLSTQAAAESFHCSNPSDLLGEGNGAGISGSAAWQWRPGAAPLIGSQIMSHFLQWWTAGQTWVNDPFVSPASYKSWVLSLSVSAVLLLTSLSSLVLNIYFQDLQYAWACVYIILFTFMFTSWRFSFPDSQFCSPYELSSFTNI